jgi:hypothetical protein
MVMSVCQFISTSFFPSQKLDKFWQNLIRKSMELSPSWEASSRTVTHEFPQILCNPKVYYLVGFYVFTAVTMKNAVLWDVKPCRFCEMNRRFGGTDRPRVADCCYLRSRVPPSRIFVPWRWKRYVHPKCRLISQNLHGITSQRTVFFIYYLSHKSPLLISTQNQINPFQNTPYSYSKIHINVILQFTSRSS